MCILLQLEFKKKILSNSKVADFRMKTVEGGRKGEVDQIKFLFG